MYEKQNFIILVYNENGIRVDIHRGGQENTKHNEGF